MNINVIFNSGAASEFSLGKNENISKIGLKNTSKEFFETANLTIFDIGDDSDNLDINTPVDIYVDNNHEFSGYVNRIRKRLDGSLFFDVSCIGNTSVLSRFNTPSDTTFTEKYSGYIVSSLTNSYASGNGNYVTPPDIDDTTGRLIEYIDLSNKSLNNCFNTLSNFDGYRYYVNPNNKLIYNQVSDTSQFTITHDDIKGKMSIEKSDDTIKNKVLVVGSQEFGMESQEGELPADGWYMISTSRLVAQRMSVPNTYSGGQHYTKFYASSTAEIPSYIEYELYRDDSGEPSSSSLPSSNIKWNGTSLSNREGWMDYKENADHLDIDLSSQSTYWTVLKSDCTDTNSHWKIAYDSQGSINFDFSSDPNIEDTLDYGGEDYGKVVYDGSNDEVDFYLKPPGYLMGGGFEESRGNRYRDIPVSTASYPDGITKDNIKYKVSANILDYKFMSSAIYEEKEEADYESYPRFRPRAFIALTSDNEATYDYDPMFGFEYSLYNPRIESFDRGYYDCSNVLNTVGNITVQNAVTISSPSSLRIEGNPTYSYTDWTLYSNDDENITKFSVKLQPSAYDSSTNYPQHQLYLSGFDTDGNDHIAGKIELKYHDGNLNIVANDDSTFGSWVSGTTYEFILELTDGGNKVYIQCPTIGSSQTYNPYHDYTYDSFTHVAILCMLNMPGTTAPDPSYLYVDDIRWWTDPIGPTDIQVRPFCGIRTSENINDVTYKYGDWQTTGSTYTCDLNGNNFIFSVDDVVKQTWDVHNYTFDGNFKFGTGHSHTWDNLRIGMVDGGIGADGDITNDGVWISGNVPWFEVYASTGARYAAYSDDGGSTWTTESDKSLVIKTGWDYDYLKGEASSQSSIDTYGKRFYKEQQPLLTKQVDVDNYADEIISEYSNGKDKGNIIIAGRSVDIDQKFTISSSYLDVDDTFEIVAYEHSIDRKGWNTSLTYGEIPYSIAAEVNKNTSYRRTGD